MQYRSWQKGEDWAVLVEVNEYREKNTLRREITVFRRVERDFRRSDESHEVDIHDAAAVQELLQRVGFDVQVTPAYGSHPLAARRLAFIATKRPE